ncbi:MAG: hypothetical protein ACYC5M_07950 [Anaerolineae bacterium]
MRRSLRVGLFATILWVLLAPCILAEGPDAALPGTSTPPYLALQALSWLLPLGIALVAVGLAEPRRALQVASSLPLALAVAVLGYYASGFAMQFGGVGLISDHPDLAALVAEWSPLDLSLGPGWGLTGLRGFGLPADLVNETVLTLFIAQLPLVTTAALIPLLALNGYTPRLPALALALLVAAVGYPLAGNWLWGGGWLSQLGVTLQLGQGTVDHGMASLHVIGAGAAVAGLAVFRHMTPGPEKRTAPHLPSVFLPLFVLSGAFLTLIGWLAITAQQPIHTATPSIAGALLNGLLAASAATLATMLYGWMARGEPDAGLTGRGLVAGLVAISAGSSALPSWGALLVGAVAGLALAPTMYLFDRVLRLGDTAAVLSTHGASALWGLIATGLLTTDTSGQGPAGYLLGGGSGQWHAQLIGAAGILLLSLLGPGVLLAVLAQAYQLPATMRERARLRAEQIQLQREAREIMRQRGEAVGLVQRAQTTLLNLTAGQPRLRARRRRLSVAPVPAKPSARSSRPSNASRRRRMSSPR